MNKLSVRLSPEDEIRLEYIAGTHGLSKAEMIRALIEKEHKRLSAPGDVGPRPVLNHEGQEYGRVGGRHG